MFFTSRGFSFFWDVVILNRNRTETTFLPVQKRKEIAMANMYRDVNLSEVNESYIGKELKVAGWVENIRDHGGVSFIDLRDMYGVLQVVLRDTTLLDGIHKEECIAIEMRKLIILRFLQEQSSLKLRRLQYLDRYTSSFHLKYRLLRK